MNSIKVIRPQGKKNVLTIGSVKNTGWYSYEDESGIVYIDPDADCFVQLYNRGIDLCAKSFSLDNLVYPIEVDMTIQVGYIN